MCVTRTFSHVDNPTTWHQLLSQYIFKTEYFKVRRGLSGDLYVRQLGDIRITHLRVRGMDRMERQHAEIKSSPSDSLIAILQMEGTCTLVQDNRSVVAHPDDLVCIDSRRPAAWHFGEKVEALLVHLPYSAVTEGLGRTENFTAVKLNDAYVLGSLLATYLRDLTTQLESISEEAAYSLAQIALCLVITALSERPENALSTARRAVLDRAQAYMQTHSRTPSLTPPAVAAALKISERYLQALFKAAGDTPRNYLLQCRLKNAEADLMNPCLNWMSITDIALRAGFTQPTHFSQRFKEAYGVSAREFRKRARQAMRGGEGG